MRFGVTRNGSVDKDGDDAINAMSGIVANNVRTESSATLDEIRTTIGQNDEQSEELLKDEEHDIRYLLEGVGSKRADVPKHRDSSQWLRHISLVFGAVVIITLVFASWDALLDTFNVFHFGSDGSRDSYTSKIGIDLNPTNHVFRAPTTITHNWIITKGFLSPDGVKKEVYLVNEQFPGPTLQCRSGDKLIIHVTNHLFEEEVSLHWHGLQMRNSNFMDGAAGFTQCPIPPEEKYTYEFDIDGEQSGTFWWHAHSQTQRGDGMYGGLVVHKPAKTQSDMELYGYRKEMLLLVGDWYHRNATEVLEWYTSVRGFGNEPVPDSLLLNGVGRFMCSMAVPARPVECVDTDDEHAIGMHMKGATRIRVINVGTLAGFSLGVDSGALFPITVDGGHPIEGRIVQSIGIIYPGERVDLISKLDTSLGSPRLRISLDRENFKYPNHALRPDQSFPALASSNHQSNESAEVPTSATAETHFDLASASSAKASGAQIPENASQTILLYTKTQKLSINANHPQGFMNRTSWDPQSPALISLPRTSWDLNQLVPFIPSHRSSPSWVDMIVNNLDDGAHPFHLHGHDFYILSSYRSEHGWGSYSPWATAGSSAITPNLNLINPVMKDTVSVPRRGYVILRFRADNPGIWMFHCHILFHQGSGMAMGIHVGENEGHEDIDPRGSKFCTQSN